MQEDDELTPYERLSLKLLVSIAEGISLQLAHTDESVKSHRENLKELVATVDKLFADEKAALERKFKLEYEANKPEKKK